MMKIENKQNNSFMLNARPFSKTRAIIFAIENSSGMNPLLNSRPQLLLNIGDKPIIIHIVEKLAKEGVDTFELVLHHFPEQIEEVLDTGSRWGVKIHYHLAKDIRTPLKAIVPAIRDWEPSRLLIGVGDNLPFFSSPPEAESGLSVFYNYAPQDWSGWAFLMPEHLSRVPPNAPYNKIPSHFKTSMAAAASPYISARNCLELKNSNKKFLNREDPDFLFPTTAKKVEEGVWISRAVTIEPGVEVIPPILIGENTHIKAGAKIGPDAIIENHCIVDNGTTIENSLICQNSYVGENLEIVDCIVDRNAIINLSLGSQVTVREEFLISGLMPPPIQPIFQKIFESAVAFLLFVALSPIFFVLRCCYRLKNESMLALPAPEDCEQWKTFNLYWFERSGIRRRFAWLPQLFNIIKGELSFVGTPPRTPQETEKLPEEWKKLYLKTKPGIITLCDVYHGKNATDDEMYASEAYYAAQMSLLFDIKLIFSALLKRLQKLWL